MSKLFGSVASFEGFQPLGWKIITKRQSWANIWRQNECHTHCSCVCHKPSVKNLENPGKSLLAAVFLSGKTWLGFASPRWAEEVAANSVRQKHRNSPKPQALANVPTWHDKRHWAIEHTAFTLASARRACRHNKLMHSKQLNDWLQKKQFSALAWKKLRNFSLRNPNISNMGSSYAVLLKAAGQGCFQSRKELFLSQNHRWNC